MAGRIGKKEEDAFKMMLVVDSLRGPHSTGVAAVGGNGNWGLAKKKGNPWDLFDSKEYDKAMTGVNYVLIGHNRYATKGKINNINAHPFEFKDVVGVHNGTIRGQHRLKDYEAFEVDSENIYHCIQNYGLDDTLATLEGAYALVYWDKRDESLVMLRNSERSLWYALSEDRKTIFWASEHWMIKACCDRAGIKTLNPVDIKPLSIHRFNIDRKWHCGEVTVDYEEFEEFKAPPVKVPPVSYGLPPAKKEPVPEKKTMPSATSSTRDCERKDPSKFLSKRVEFTIDGEAVSSNNQHYLSGTLVEQPHTEVRVHAQPGTSLWEELYSCWDVTFVGLAKSYRKADNEEYFSIDLRSIEIVEDEDEWEEMDVKGPGGKFIHVDRFSDLTRKGCAFCGGDVTTADHMSIVWTENNDFICVDCQETQEAKEYMGAV